MEAEFSGLFAYGVAYLNRIIEMTFNPFWNDVLSSLKLLWTDLKIVIPENVLLTPLWYNDSLQLPIKKEWLWKGITNVSDILDNNLKPLLLHDFISIYGVKTNFLEYGHVCKKVKVCLDNKILPFHLPTKPYNSMLNVILSLDTKGVSNIYKLLKGNNSSVLENATNKWNEKIDFQLDVFSLKKSFSKIKMFDDVYLRYIQFRTLHRRFFTNNILFKMKQKSSVLCDFCKNESDSNEHMFLSCAVIRQLWRDVENWISQIGVADYVINEEIIILGELKKSHWLNSIILLTKKIIFTSKLNLTIPTMFCIKAEVKSLFEYEKLKFILLDRYDLLEKRWGMMLEYFEDDILQC